MVSSIPESAKLLTLMTVWKNAAPQNQELRTTRKRSRSAQRELVRLRFKYSQFSTFVDGSAD
jgi:hypothetical protein